MPRFSFYRRWFRMLSLSAAVAAALVVADAGAAQASCGSPVACENQLPGDPRSDWQTTGVGDGTIQGYATSMSVNVGQTESFKINTPSTAYHIDILRLGYYGGDGARKIASNIKPSVSLPQTQPACMTDSSTGLIDCGNWSVSASWTVPSDAVSGVYIAHLVRDDPQDPGGDSQIPFVVRNDASHSDAVVATSDATWQAYNDYGGNSLYSCSVACPPGNPLAYKAAYAVSYNRPFSGAFNTDGGASYLWYAEYQMIYWLEENGYDVSYVSDTDLERSPGLLLNHKLFISSGHDEYWSAGERAGVQAAVNAGVNLAFFSGNEMFWKTRWANSEDGSNTPYRTLISYKETHFDAPTDPADPPTWTGTWADPRFSPPADGGSPANSLTGQEFLVVAGTGDMTVPYQDSQLRFWRNTPVANLTAGHSLTLDPGCGNIGFEWDVDADNGFRPAGEFDLSSTTLSNVQPFTDYGSTTSTGTETHHLTLYRAPSGALVFGAGTVQWAWGLDQENAWNSAGPPGACQPDPSMQQATVNLLADMGVQPTTLISGLTPAAQSTNTTPPSSAITSPSAGASVPDGTAVTITGTAKSAGGVVAGVEISTDGGSSWHPTRLITPDGTSVSWSYSWIAHGYPSATIETRAVDDSGNLETPSDALNVTVTCPCSLWGTNIKPTTVPFGVVDSGDAAAITVGVQFTGSIDSTVTGIRFYKASTNTGTHVGRLWTSSGTLLAKANFTNETASGWQTVKFSSPIVLQAGQTYVAAYFAPNGHYSKTAGWFYRPPAPTPLGGATTVSGPWHALTASGATQNGVFSYGSSSSFPSSNYQAANYWVDPILSTVSAPGQATGVSATAGGNSAVVTWSAPSSGGPSTTYTITPYIGSTPQTPTSVAGAPAPTSATITGLTANTTYTFTVTASNTSGIGPASAPSNAVVPFQAVPPSAPSGVSATPATSEALVSWAPPSSNGGSPITSYTITPYNGSSAQTPMTINSGSATSATVTGLTNGASYTFTVAANNSAGSGSASSPSSAVTPGDTLFDFSTPALVDSGDSTPNNLGVEFTPSQSGAITGIRFYKAAANTGTHVGSLWDTSGNLLTQGTFTNETASGWQTLTFACHVPVTAGTTYIASYLAPNGHFSMTRPGFNSAVTNGPLTAPASSSTIYGNGVYANGSTTIFPTNSYQATNYGVDVLFTPGDTGCVPTPPNAPSSVLATPASSEALVSWTPPSSNGGRPITSYTITPYVGSSAQTPVTVNSGSATSATVTGLTNGASYTFTVTANNSIGPGSASSPSSAVTPEDTLFDFSTPGTIDPGDSTANNLGVEFTSTQSGAITGIRFYKAATNTGTHVGSLWDTSGDLLAQGTFANETTSGWQTLTFACPVAISPNITYIASYLAPNGHFSMTRTGFSSAVTNGPLTAPASASTIYGNGVYANGSTTIFPTNSYQATNYSVDVLFSPGGRGCGNPPAAPTNVAAAPASSQALVSWKVPNNGGSAITSYTITPYIGSSAQTPVTVNNGSATSATVTGLTNGTSYTFTVTANNSIGSGTASSPSSAVTPEDTLFDFSTPGTVDSGDSTPNNLGVEFTSSQSGAVAGIRFYKAAANTGTHVGSLWDVNGNLLAQGTFTNETGSGWQTLTFACPVAISPNTTYIASYLAPNGHFALTRPGFSSAVTNGPLTAPASSSTTYGNGVYANGSTTIFPTNSYQATNYGVDVLFSPGGSGCGNPPVAPTNVAAAPASSRALVSWTAPSSNGGSPITSYTITPYIGSSAETPVTVNSGSATSATVTGLTNGTSYTFTVKANNNVGAGTPSAASSAIAPEDTLFDFSTPQTVDSGDSTPNNLGVEFVAAQNGTITGMRFYKAAANTGTHVGSLWDANGNLLAQGTFTNETASGWQTLIFASPVSITAGNTYIASYLAPNGHFSLTRPGFASAVTNGPLTAPASSSTTYGNGVYANGSTAIFPTNTYGSTNYGVDIMFNPS